IWSGVVGGLFLQLSYFGTDHSQVGRYIGGTSVKESRLGLLFNGLLKIPMQLFILSCGVLVFLFYQFNQPPVYFDEVALDKVRNSQYADSLTTLEHQLDDNFNQKQDAFNQYLNKDDDPGIIQQLDVEHKSINNKINNLVTEINTGVNEDHDFVFMTFVLDYLPAGLIGLLFAVIFCASFSSKSSEINALAATFVVDIYKRKWKVDSSENHYLNASKLSTLFFAILAVCFALVCSLFDNLIEAVNIIGSLFYGTILGVFLTAFLLKFVKGNAVFIAAIISEIFIIFLDQSIRHPEWGFTVMHVGYLWYNVIGCLLVMILSSIIQAFDLF
ncbi:MAG: sodium:solute symporter, partial [Chitinophagales bacterium]